MGEHKNELSSSQIKSRGQGTLGEHAVIHKDGAYWIAVARRFLGNQIAYQICTDLEKNGFEEMTDAYAYLSTLTQELI